MQPAVHPFAELFAEVFGLPLAPPAPAPACRLADRMESWERDLNEALARLRHGPQYAAPTPDNGTATGRMIPGIPFPTLDGLRIRADRQISKSISVPVHDADGWITWGGGLSSPLPNDRLFEFRMRNGQEVNGWKGLRWSHLGHPDDIVAYRLIPAPAATPTMTETRMLSGTRIGTVTEPAPAPTTRIGTHWAAQGGVYAGRTTDENGEYDLVLRPQSLFTRWMTSHDAEDAAGLAHGFNDWDLPTLQQAYLILANFTDGIPTHFWVQPARERMAMICGAPEELPAGSQCQVVAVRRVEVKRG